MFGDTSLSSRSISSCSDSESLGVKIEKLIGHHPTLLEQAPLTLGVDIGNKIGQLNCSRELLAKLLVST